jgi:hypothetical protein
MANCLVARRQLELAEFDEHAFLGADAERHLDECADCRAFASDMRALRGMLADQPRVAVPPNFETSLKARIRREAPRYREPRLAWIPTPALGAIALATVISVGFAVRSNFAPLEPANVASTSNAAISLPVSPAQKVETAAVRPIAATPVAMTTARPVVARFARSTHRTTLTTLVAETERSANESSLYTDEDGHPLSANTNRDRVTTIGVVTNKRQINQVIQVSTGTPIYGTDSIIPSRSAQTEGNNDDSGPM